MSCEKQELFDICDSFGILRLSLLIYKSILGKLAPERR